MFQRFIAKFNLRLVYNWRQWWKWASIRIAAFASALIATLFAFPDMALSVLHSMPAETREYLSPIVGTMIFAILLFSRVTQKKREEDHERGY